MAHSAIMSVRITGNSDDAVKAFQKATSKAAAFGSFMGGAALKGVTELWDKLKDFGGAVIDMSDSTDKFVQTMNFAGIDTSNVEKASQAARDYADRTVYDLSTIQNTTAQLAANGISDYTGLTEAAGNLNAEKDGAYSRIFFDKLTPAEQDAFDTAPRNGVEALQHEMGLLKLRELKILEKIKEYEDMNPDTLITSSVLDMRVPGKVGKTGKKEDGKVQTMGMYSRDTPFARILKLQDALYKTQGRIAAVAGALRAAEESDRRMELEKQRLELLRIRATGEVPEDGDKDGLVHD